MKKIFLAIIGTLLIAIISLNNVNGQDVAVSAGKHPELKNAPANEIAGKSAAPVATLNVSAKAIKDFTKNYKAQPFWSNSANGGQTASFVESGIENSVYYDKKGHWICNIKRYDESKLSKEIRRVVKPVYYDYQINGVAEIILPGKIIHLLYVQDAHNFKTVRVCDGEMDVIEWFQDGKVIDLPK